MQLERLGPPLRPVVGALALPALLATALAAIQGNDLRAQAREDLPAEDRWVEPVREEVFRVGSIAGDPWETFGETVRTAFDRAGNLYLLDVDNHRVVVVDVEGNLVREFGQAGGGPGEFRMPMGVAVTPEGEVVVSDLGQRGLLVFSEQGEYLRSVPADLERGFPSNDFVADPAGGAILSPPGGIRVSMRAPGGDGGSGSSLLIQRFDITAEGEPETLYAAWEPPPAGGGEGGTIDMGGGRSVQISAMSRLRAFEPRVLFGVMPDGGLVVADTVDYRVSFLSPDGRPRKVLRRPIHPREVTADIREAERQRRLEELEEGSGPRLTMITEGGGGGRVSSAGSDGIAQMMRDRIERMDFMDEVPVLAGLGVDHAGRVWLRRSGGEIGEDGPIDLISPVGAYLGSVRPGLLEIPAAFGPDGLAAFVRRDDLDVVTVEVERIRF